MAFILDHSDPNGQGMFSKAGRITSAKYVVFQKKGEILENQRKFLKDLEQQKEDPNKNFLEEEQAPKPKVVVNIRKRPQTVPFESNRNPPPAIGTYNPKHSSLLKHSAALFDYSREKAKPRYSSRAETARLDSERTEHTGQHTDRPITTTSHEETEYKHRKLNPEKPRKKIVGPTLFRNMTSRETLSRPGSSYDVHEERFVYHGLPSTFSKTRRVPGFRIANQAGRESGRYKRNERALPDYAPNFEYGKRQLGSSGPAFNKLTGRKDPSYVSYSINEDFFNVNKSLLLKFPKQKNPDFSKDLPRESTNNTPLPCFMQKGNYSRLGMELGGQKTLEINNFSEARFQSNLSTFSPRPESGGRYSTKINTWRI